MASLSEDDRKRGSKAIAEALMSDTAASGSSGRAAAAGVTAAAADPKKLFCENWATVKSVLQVLRQFAPGFVKPLIDIVIKAGDALKKAICR